MRKSRTAAALVLTIVLAVPAFSMPQSPSSGPTGPIDRIVQIIKKIFSPVKTLDQPIVPVPAANS